MGRRGQVATELLIILSVVLVVIAILIVSMQTSLFSAKSEYKENQARLALDDVKNSAEFIYHQGLGARTTVYITIPKNVAYTNVTTNYISITFDNGNTIVSSLDFNVSGDLPDSSGGYWIEMETRENYVLLSTNLTEVEVCGDSVCAAGENCPADIGGCTNNVCYTPTCLNGCSDTAIVSAVDSGECDATTLAGSCVDVPCICDGSSVCVDDTEIIPTVNLMDPVNGATNSSNLIDFVYNVSSSVAIANCSLYIDGVLNMTDSAVVLDSVENITITLNEEVYTWAVNCTDTDNGVGGSGSRTLTIGASGISYLDLWPYTVDGMWPVIFTSGVNSTANTFWLVGGNDGWDWKSDSYMGHASSLDTCVSFTNNGKIEIAIGDEGCGSGDDLGQGSGVYGVEFYLSSSDYAIISSGGSANISFDWGYTAMSAELDNAEDIWVKGTIGNGTLFAYEDFEAGYLGSSHEWEGGSGWLYDWYRDGDGIQDVQGEEYSGRYAMQLSDDDNWVDRAVDLSSATNPRIKLYAKCTGLETSDYAHFKISSDDSVWTTLETWTNGDDDNIWREYDFDLTSYFDNSNEFWIAFDTPDFNNANDKCYFDQILIYEGNTNYLGSALDGAADEGEVWDEIYWEENPGSSASGFYSEDVTSVFTESGWYYLSLGGMVYRWNSANEGANFYFDNITLYVSE
jgi:uncharacterized protein (UPF0333 family)